MGERDNIDLWVYILLIYRVDDIIQTLSLGRFVIVLLLLSLLFIDAGAAGVVVTLLLLLLELLLVVMLMVWLVLLLGVPLFPLLVSLRL